jgi:hypothetical protein
MAIKTLQLTNVLSSSLLKYCLLKFNFVNVLEVCDLVHEREMYLQCMFEKHVCKRGF